MRKNIKAQTMEQLRARNAAEAITVTDLHDTMKEEECPTYKRKMRAESLAVLRDDLNAMEEKLAVRSQNTCQAGGRRFLEEIVDLSGLPTFGGEEPHDTIGIYSWDESGLLMYEYDGRQTVWKIVPRME